MQGSSFKHSVNMILASELVYMYTEPKISNYIVIISMTQLVHHWDFYAIGEKLRGKPLHPDWNNITL